MSWFSLDVTRRSFLQAAAAGLVAPSLTFARARERLYNGIELASPWPPRRLSLSTTAQRPPYENDRPDVIDIDIGRQLFVDDFLIDRSSLYREFHQTSFHPNSPVLHPERQWEIDDPFAKTTSQPPSPCAMVFSDGVFYDPDHREYRMWYMAGYQQHTALAVSSDGLTWHRPRFNVIPGTNIVTRHKRDSSTVWLDLDATDRSRRYRMASYDLGVKALQLFHSADGIHWTHSGASGQCGDRSTIFRNPFRDRWVFSLRADEPNSLVRYRRYFETDRLDRASWRDGEPVAWSAADTEDIQRRDLQTAPQIYNLDAVAYESVILGLFGIYRGEKPDREKPNDICVAFSRDGFHWSRLSRSAFIPVSERQGDWNWSNVQSAGGCCLIAGDELRFYVSGRAGIPGTSLPGVCSTGLAVLRRDGFASVSDQWPVGVPRALPKTDGLVTRPVTFSGRHVFVNASGAGSLRVELLDREGRVIEPFSAGNCNPVTGTATKTMVTWKSAPSLESLANKPVRFRFVPSQMRLYSFWVSPSPSGFSRGYLAGGGPGIRRSADLE